MAEHSPYGPSSIARVDACPGSVRECAKVPVFSSPDADEGTLAHSYCEKIMRGEVGLMAVPKENDMRESVQVCTDAWRSEIAMAGKNAIYFFEKRLDLSKVYPGCFGTADCIVYNPNKKELLVSDFKNGAGEYVDVTDNKQAKCYALGATLLPELAGKEINTIRLQIIQPRIKTSEGVIRDYTIDAFELSDFFFELRDICERAAKKNAPLASGSHCKFCNAKPMCPELRSKAFDLATKEFDCVPKADGSLPIPSDPEKLAKALKWAPILKSWIDSVYKYAYQLAIAGKSVEGFKLVEKRATRKWKDELKVIEIMRSANFKDEEIFETKLKSPAQVEKGLKSKEDKAFIQKFIEKKSSGLKLVPETDRGIAVKAGAEVEFSKLSG